MPKVKLPRNLRTNLVTGPWGTGDPDFDSVILLLPFEDNIGTSEITDQSLSNRTAIFNETAAVSSVESRFGTRSLSLDGDSDWLEYANSSDWVPDVDYTIECHARAISTKAVDTILGYRISGAQHGWIIALTADDFRFLGWGSGASTPKIDLTGPVAVIDTWYHIAVSRTSAGLWRLFVDGLLVASDTETGGITDLTQPLFVGRDFTTTNREWDGNIDNVRITRGVCRYTESFDPPDAPYPNYKKRVKQTEYYDQYADDIVFQLSMNGTDGGTTFTDASPNAHVFTATSATTSNEQIKFGTASMKAIDGLDYYIGTPTATITSTSTSFTMEGWIYTNGLSYFGSSRVAGDHVMFSEEKNAGNSNQFFRVGDNGSVGFFQGSGITGAGNVSMGTAAGLVPDATWTHVAICYDDPVQRMRIYVGGIKGADASWTTGGWFSQTRDFIIGASSLPSYQVWRLQMNAYVDDLRVTEAVRYRENFTPPTKAFPAL